MASLSISRAWDETKSRVATDGRLMMLVAAALLLLPQALASVVAPPETLSGEEPAGGAMVLSLLVTLLGIVGQIAIIRLALTQGISVGEAIGHGFKRFLPVFVAVLLLMLAMFAVLVPLLLLIGGAGILGGAAGGAMTAAAGIAAVVVLLLAIFIGPRFLLIMPVAAAESGGPIQILKRSWSASSGHYLRLLAFIVLMLIAAVILMLAVQFLAGSMIQLVFGDIAPMSIAALLYGLLFGLCQAALGVLVSVMLARMYVQIAGGESLEVSVPSSGT